MTAFFNLFFQSIGKHVPAQIPDLRYFAIRLFTNSHYCNQAVAPTILGLGILLQFQYIIEGFPRIAFPFASSVKPFVQRLDDIGIEEIQ